MGAAETQRYEAKLKRVLDAAALKQPDRVPIVAGMQGFVPHYSGMTLEQVMRDEAACEAAFDKFFDDFDPDLAWDPTFMYPVRAFETLGLRYLRWPGGGLGPSTLYQFIEGDYMKADEYDELIADPTRYVLTRWIPRCFSALTGLKSLSGIANSVMYGFMGTFTAFAGPKVQAALGALMKAGEELKAWGDFVARYDEKLKARGFPVAYGAYANAPFDMIGDSMRGTVEILMDMRERPQKLLAAMDALLPIALETAIGWAKATGRPFVWIWLHKGLDDFMSPDDYNTFYWPTLKALIVGLTEAGLIPVVYTEGRYNTRLETLRGVPRGKVVYHFENVDMARAKEVLGDVACISGNVPATLLYHGTPDDVRAYCRTLIDACARGGGFWMDTDGLVDDAKPENVKAMFDFTREYGVY